MIGRLGWLHTDVLDDVDDLSDEGGDNAEVGQASQVRKTVDDGEVRKAGQEVAVDENNVAAVERHRDRRRALHHSVGLALGNWAGHGTSGQHAGNSDHGGLHLECFVGKGLKGKIVDS